MHTFTQWADHYGYDTTTNEGMEVASIDYAEYLAASRALAALTN